MGSNQLEPMIQAKIERVVASADGEQLKKNRFNEGNITHKLYLKDEQIRIKKIENKAVHERR